MLIVMKFDATEAQVDVVLRELGFKPHPMPGATRTAIGITGNQGAIDPSHFENLPGVGEAIRVSKPYKLVSRDLKHDDTIVNVGEVEIGGAEPAIIAGPCAVESLEQTLEIAELVASTGVKFFRGGAFKPRTSPYAFQGLGADGLKILAQARDRYGLRIVTTGKRHNVIPLARAAIAAGADGIMVEVHNHPEKALSDGPQALLPEMFRQLVEEVRAIHRVIKEAELRASGAPAAASYPST